MLDVELKPTELAVELEVALAVELEVALAVELTEELAVAEKLDVLSKSPDSC